MRSCVISVGSEVSVDDLLAAINSGKSTFKKVMIIISVCISFSFASSFLVDKDNHHSHPYTAVKPIAESDIHFLQRMCLSQDRYIHLPHLAGLFQVLGRFKKWTCAKAQCEHVPLFCSTRLGLHGTALL